MIKPIGALSFSGDEMSQTINVGILKAGCIGTLPLLEFLLDERADRRDISVTVIGSGAKLGVEECREKAEIMVKVKPDLVILAGPAQAAPGPTEARNILRSSGIPTIVISDSPAKKLRKTLEKEGFGYIIVEADSMIGARREFLDPTEMAIYNSDVIRVLAVTGALRVIVEEIDRVIEALKRGEEPALPRLVIDKNTIMERRGFSNPYSKAKAIAAYEISRRVADINTEACFKVSEWEVYTELVAAGHEMMRVAARLVDEAREIEKMNDSVLRTPHFGDGSRGEKSSLIEKPRRGG